MHQDRNNLKITTKVRLFKAQPLQHTSLQCQRVSIWQFAFCVSHPRDFPHYSCGLKSHKFTFTTNFVVDPLSSTEPHGSDGSPWEGRASPLRAAPSNQAMPSRTQHSPAEHTEHDQHFEQAELFTILKVLSEVCPGQTLVLGGIPFYTVGFFVLFLFVFFWNTRCLDLARTFSILSSLTFICKLTEALILAASELTPV